MASLRDRTFDRQAWVRVAMVFGVFGVIGGLIYGSTVAHHELIQKPRMMKTRHSEPVGTPGMATTQITRMGSEAVPILLEDMGASKPLFERQKSLEMLSAIDDPRVLPVLMGALNERDIGMRLSAIAGLGRRGKPDAFDGVWKHRDDENDLIRHRIYVLMGLIAAESHVPTLLDEADKLTGKDRNLLYWAAGYVLRRIDSDKRGDFARPVRGPEPEDHAGEQKLIADIIEIKRKIVAKEGKREDLAKELSRLTSTDFTTWNFGKRIAHQTIAISGPGAIVGMAKIDYGPKPPAHYEPLKLKKKSIENSMP